MEFDLRTDNLSATDLEDNFDFDYSVGEVFIDSMEMFRRELMVPFRDKDRHIFYRGERVGGLNRPLLPTMYRNKNALMKNGGHCVEVNADFLLEYYKSYGSFYDLYNTTFGTAGKYRLYDLCAFSQHYLNDSPLIDFTKSLYVALSFGLKEKRSLRMTASFTPWRSRILATAIPRTRWWRNAGSTTSRCMCTILTRTIPLRRCRC